MPNDRQPPPSPQTPIPSAPPNASSDAERVSRRSFIQTVGLSAAGATLAPQVERAAAAPQDGAPGGNGSGAGAVPIIGPDPAAMTLRVNGRPLEKTLDPATTLLEALRVHHDLTGSKEVCDRGSCGGCSVLVDGRLVAACMMLASDAVGSEVTTIEGLAQGDKLHVIQESFIRHDALQCGFCTPGLIMASKALLDDTPKPTLDEIKHGLSGNLCRCGTYPNVFNAVLEASGQQPLQDQGGQS